MGDRPAAPTGWEAVAETISWARPPRAVRSEGRPGTWFPGGELNLAFNCVDRHLPDRAEVAAIHWEGEPGDRLTITYGDLHARVRSFARGLERLGVTAGDRVALHLAPVPELPVAMLACLRLGAVFATLASGLPSEAIAERLRRFRARVLVTQDGGWRHGAVVPLKARADEALEATGTVEHVVVVRRTGIDVNWYESDRWFGDVVVPLGPPGPCPAFPADHPALVCYVPHAGGLRGLVHGTAGVLSHVTAMHRALAPAPDDVLWCAWEAAWLPGSNHGILGPLACGGSSVVYEGTLDAPNRNRTWDIIDRYQVTSIGTTPTVAEKLRRWSTGHPPRHAIRSVRRLVTAAEALAAPDRDWLVDVLAGVRATLHDGWGQMELGGIVTLTPATPVPPPDPGLDVVDAGGDSVPPGETGELVLRRPWAGLHLAVEDDDPPGVSSGPVGLDGDLYHTRDRARRGLDGGITILDRLDPMVKVSGQMVSTAVIAEVLCQHPLVRDAEVLQVTGPDGVRLLVAWVAPEPGPVPAGELAGELRSDVHEMLGGLWVPSVFAFVEEFPPELSREQRRRALLALPARESFQIFHVTADRLRRLAGADMPFCGGTGNGNHDAGQRAGD